MEYYMNVKVIETSGWLTAINGLRASYNSVSKSDSFPNRVYGLIPDPLELGPKDRELMKKLISEATGHHSDSFSKFLRAIHIGMIVRAPMYWWQEFDTYKVGVTRLSSSLMHRHMNKEFTPEEFEYIDNWRLEEINCARELYGYNLKHKDEVSPERISLLLAKLRSMIPSGYLYTSYVDTNMQTLLHMANDRSDHRLPHWRSFIDACIDQIPWFEDFYAAMTPDVQRKTR